MEDVTILTSMIGVVYDTVEGRPGGEKLVLESADHKAEFYHDQDCCEHVCIAQIDGTLDDLVGAPIALAEVVHGGQIDPKPEYPDSWTWTFLKLATAKGYVTVRWLGESNGYYSEDIDWRIDGRTRWGWE